MKQNSSLTTTSTTVTIWQWLIIVHKSRIWLNYLRSSKTHHFSLSWHICGENSCKMKLGKKHGETRVTVIKITKYFYQIREEKKGQKCNEIVSLQETIIPHGNSPASCNLVGLLHCLLVTTKWSVASYTIFFLVSICAYSGGIYPYVPCAQYRVIIVTMSQKVTDHFKH